MSNNIDYFLPIEALYTMLSTDTNISTRNSLTTKFYKILDIEEVLTDLARQGFEQFRQFLNPVICISSHNNISFIQDLNNVFTADKVEPNLIIDCLYNDYDLTKAKKEALYLAEDIRQKIINDKCLNNSVYTSRVKAIESLGYLNYDECPFNYAFRVHLEVTFR